MERIEWIDAIKGIGILLIMLSHCINFEGLDYLTAGYIPLFFIISGTTFSPNKNSLVKRLKRLLYPNYIYAFIITIIFSIPHIIFKWGWTKMFYGWANLLYSRNRVYEGSLHNNIILEGVFPVITWFLTAMSISYILLYGYFKINIKWRNIYILFSLISLILICLQKRLLPWSMDTALILWLFILFGYKFKSFFINLSINIPTLVLSCILLMLYYILVNINGSPNYSIRYWGNFNILSIPCCFIIGILYTYIATCVTLLIKKTFLFKPLAIVGQASLTLMCLHLAIYRCCDFTIMIMQIANINLYVLGLIKMLSAILIVFYFKTFINKYNIKYPILKWL